MRKKNIVYTAPANIALIKYMGKEKSDSNIPTNDSLSFTLDHLRSFVRLTELTDQIRNSLVHSGIRYIEFEGDLWSSLNDFGDSEIKMSEKGASKFLRHFQKLKKMWGIETQYLVESNNNFPSDCGIASSSSSFAALTYASYKQFFKGSESLTMSELSALSRLGSGSSCRSFFQPFAIWKQDRAYELKTNFKPFHHIILLLDIDKKEVSSSEAHLRVVTSPIFKKRLEKVHQRLEKVKTDLQLEFQNESELIKIWNHVCEVVYEEFEEMHQLFESSVPPFTYRSQKTFEVLESLKKMNQGSEKVMVTMDAGSNIHFMFRNENLEQAKKWKIELLMNIEGINTDSIISSWEKSGNLSQTNYAKNREHSSSTINIEFDHLAKREFNV